MYESGPLSLAYMSPLFLDTKLSCCICAIPRQG